MQKPGDDHDVIVMATERFEASKRVIGGLAYPAHGYGKVIYAARGADVGLRRIVSTPRF